MSDFEYPDGNPPEPNRIPPRRGFGNDVRDKVGRVRQWSWGTWIIVGLILIGGLSWFGYSACKITVPDKHIAILIRKTGKDIPNNEEVAPSAEYKGVQKEFLTEGRYFYNPFVWDWKIVPMKDVPPGKLGVKVRLHGEDLPAGEFIAWEKNQKGIDPVVLRPGRYPINPYLETVEIFDPVTIPAGYKGIKTYLSGKMPDR